MIDRVLKRRLQVDLFCDRQMAEEDANRRLSAEDNLTSEDWRILSETHAILKPFHEMIVQLQSRAEDARNGSVWEAFSMMEYVMSSLEDQKRLY
jgi:hypothetical protein